MRELAAGRPESLPLISFSMIYKGRTNFVTVIDAILLPGCSVSPNRRGAGCHGGLCRRGHIAPAPDNSPRVGRSYPAGLCCEAIGPSPVWRNRMDLAEKTAGGNEVGKGVAPWECVPRHTRAGGRARGLRSKAWTGRGPGRRIFLRPCKNIQLPRTSHERHPFPQTNARRNSLLINQMAMKHAFRVPTPFNFEPSGNDFTSICSHSLCHMVEISKEL